MLNDNEKLKSLTQLGIELSQIQDLDILMEHILSKARGFVSADAGSIYIREGDYLTFSYTQNDTLQSRIPAGEKLIYSTFTIPIDETSLAGHVALTGEMLNIKDVYKLDPSLPYKFNKVFDVASEYRTRSVMTLPLTTSRSKIVGIIQIINAKSDTGEIKAFTKQNVDTMRHFAGIAAVALERAQMTRTILLRMIQMAEMRDPKETGAHVNRVAGYAVELYERWAKRHNVDPEEIGINRDYLRMAAMLHDVGKVAISDIILKKPGKLEPEEFEVMKEHTLHGGRLFKFRESEYEDAASIVALMHHERWDGNGYPGMVDLETGDAMEGAVLPDGRPRGRKAHEIHIFGRIVALADVYDALSSARVYKKAWEEKDVLDLIRKEAGAQFDPELVEIFFEALDVLRSIQERYKNE